jgi:F0F1-type ATP synthase epsilon subunit
MSIRVLAHRPVNVHSKSSTNGVVGGLVHCQAKQVTVVPDDAQGLDLLKKAGYITILKSKTEPVETVKPEPVKEVKEIPEDEEAEDEDEETGEEEDEDEEDEKGE